MTHLNILITGAGIAGPVLVYYLHRSTPCSITLIERSPVPRTSGQSIDIRGHGVDVIRAMGLEDAIKAQHTHEQGLTLVDASGRTKAQFPADRDGSNTAFTSEFEILRGDLARVFLDEIEGMAEVVYGEWVVGVGDVDGGKVEVEFANGRARGRYDLVVAADGMISGTRRCVFGRGPGEGDYLRKLGSYMAYFSIPKEEGDTRWAKACISTKGRWMLTRPDNVGTTKILLGVTDGDAKRFELYDRALNEGVEAQKELLRREFRDAGWIGERIARGLEGSDDFYYSVMAQVKMEKFVKGRFALVGDAGYCPAPITGQGTTTGIVGAYVLAGEISKTPDDIPGALQRYQTTLRPLIDHAQKVSPGVMKIAAPQSQVGVWIFNIVMGIVSSRPLRALGERLFHTGGKGAWNLPHYPKLGGPA